jgi:hypothetical protein
MRGSSWRTLGSPFLLDDRRQAAGADSPAPKRLSALVTFDEIVKFLEPEFVQLHDGSVVSDSRAARYFCLVLAVHFHHDPCLMPS